MMWVRAMHAYYFVNKNVKPKRIKLKESTEKAEKLEKELAEKE